MMILFIHMFICFAKYNIYIFVMRTLEVYGFIIMGRCSTETVIFEAFVLYAQCARYMQESLRPVFGIIPRGEKDWDTLQRLPPVCVALDSMCSML